ncbi:MAG: class I SAM-dependent methyltransferase [Flavobacteriales bacterium]|nr:class I SAM-dependent methyltransferase [Flavobacteriales bacterium]
MKDKEANSVKKPWPTKAAMKQVYQMKLWGGEQADFYSGTGSHLAEIVDPYIDVVTAFLASFKPPLTVCDLGCGDFNVGSKLVAHSKKYVAVDIVPELIDRNRERFNAENLAFHCLDIAVDELPAGDCAIVRQVLQHLSNAEVQSVVTKLAAYQYVIITEHLPEGAFTPNKDIISGQGTRLKKQSGVDLLAPPFNFKIKEKKHLLSVVLKDGKGMIETTLFVLS